MAGRTPVLLLHGALGSAAQLAPFAAAMSPWSDAHAIDFIGHGPATLTGPLQMERLVEQVADHVTANGLAPASLFGYSMGGYVALVLAATRPELVRAVATLGTKLEWNPAVAMEITARLDAGTIVQKLPKFAAALQATHTGIGWERLCAETRDMLTSLGERPLLTRELLAGIAQPVRLMLGDRDDTVTLAETAGVYGTLPAGELEVLPGTRHAIDRVDVERLAASLSSILAG